MPTSLPHIYYEVSSCLVMVSGSYDRSYSYLGGRLIHSYPELSQVMCFRRSTNPWSGANHAAARGAWGCEAWRRGEGAAADALHEVRDDAAPLIDEVARGKGGVEEEVIVHVHEAGARHRPGRSNLQKKTSFKHFIN